MLSIHDLLNPTTPVGDAPQRPIFNRAETPSPPRTARTPPDVSPRPPSSPPSLGGGSASHPRRALVEQHISLSQNSPPRPAPSTPTTNDGILSTSHNVRIGPRSKVETMYHYSLDATLEYPETSDTGKVGHLFDISPGDFYNPRLSFAYSQGPPNGMKKLAYCEALRDDNDELVPCKASHYTCESHF